jgi:hypothetical protein
MTMATEPPDTSASKSSAKPSNKFDPFHPDMPQIPGVSDTHLRTPRNASSAQARRFTQIGGVVAAAVVIGVAILLWVNRAPRRAAESSAAGTTATEASTPSASPPAPIPATPASQGPTVAATVEELSKPWASKTFNFVKPFTHENVHAIVIRLPGKGLWAFALQEPYGRCELEFVTDLPRLARQYGYRASHPMVANPCNNTIYDPLKFRTVGSGVWVRGEIVHGGGLRPPIAINVQVRGNSIIADRME